MFGPLLLFVSALFLCFLGDLTAWGLFHVPLLFLSRCIFYVSLSTGASFWWVSTAGFFVLMQSFIYQGAVGADLIVMIPLALSVYYIREIIDHTPISEALLVSFCLLANYILVDHGGSWFHIIRLNLVIAQLHFLLALFMLYLVRGGQGNRS